MDYKTEIVDLLKSLRGEMSQIELNTLLNLPKNTVNKWENSKKSIKWHDFVEICKLKNKPLVPIVENILACKLDSLDDFELLDILIGKECLVSVAENSSISYNTVYNWFHKESRPTLQHIFLLFDQYTLAETESLLEDLKFNFFEDGLTDDDSYLRDLVYNNPRVLLLFSLLAMPKFKPFKMDQIDEIAKLLSVPKFYLEEKLNYLIAKGAIIKEKERYLLSKKDLSLGFDRAKFINLTTYWFKETVRNMFESDRKKKNQKGGSLLGFAMYNFDDKSLKLAEDLSKKYFVELKRIAVESGPGSNVRAGMFSFYNPIGN